MHRSNLIVAGSTALGVLNNLLMIKLFGVSDSADVYFASFSLGTMAQFALMLFTEQFHVYYSKCSSEEEKTSFFSSSVLAVAVLIALATLSLVFLSSSVVNIFLSGFSIEKKACANLLFSIITTASAFIVFGQIYSYVLSFNNRYSLVFALQGIPNLLQFFALLYLFFTHPGGGALPLIAYSYLLGAAFSICMMAYFVREFQTFRISKLDVKVASYLADGVKFRLAHNIHNISSILFTNYTLSLLGGNAISIFNYGKKVSDIANSVANGPSLKKLSIDIALFISNGNTASAALASANFPKKILPPYLGLTFLGAFLALLLLHLLGGVGKAELVSIFTVTMMFTLANLLIIFETPYANINISCSKFAPFYLANILFAIGLPMVWLCIKGLGLLSTALPLVVCQVLNFFIIRRAGKRLLLSV